MIRITQGYSLSDPIAASMFGDRKRLFVDLLGWKVPVVGGQFEIDSYDGADATYLVAIDAGAHQGSMRLLPTERPHILGDLFPELCAGGVPRRRDVAEITRLCLPVRLGAAGRLRIRNMLISALVDHALDSGLTLLTGVVSASFGAQVLAMGWRGEALGPSRYFDGAELAAFAIHIDAATPGLLAATGIYAPPTLAPFAREAA